MTRKEISLDFTDCCSALTCEMPGQHAQKCGTRLLHRLATGQLHLIFGRLVLVARLGNLRLHGTAGVDRHVQLQHDAIAGDPLELADLESLNRRILVIVAVIVT